MRPSRSSETTNVTSVRPRSPRRARHSLQLAAGLAVCQCHGHHLAPAIYRVHGEAIQPAADRHQTCSPGAYQTWLEGVRLESDERDGG